MDATRDDDRPPPPPPPSSPSSPSSSSPSSPSSPADADTESGEPVVTTEYRGAGIMWSAIALVVVAAAFVVVAVQNSGPVEFDFLWWSVETPLVLIIAIAIAVTLVLDEVVGLVWRRKRRRRRSERDELRRLRSDS